MKFWIMAMHDELNNFHKNNVWFLVPRPNDHPVIDTKWVFQNRLDKFGIVTRNKAKLVAQDTIKRIVLIMIKLLNQL